MSVQEKVLLRKIRKREKKLIQLREARKKENKLEDSAVYQDDNLEKCNKRLQNDEEPKNKSKALLITICMYTK